MSEEIWATFREGLTITGIGMVLVFLTLILVALVIWALDRVFRTRQAADQDEEPVEAPTTTVVAAPAVEDDLTDQVAAIAVGLALQLQQARPLMAAAPLGATVSAVAPLPWQALADVDDEEITGEVITVAGIAGSASWKARGRLDGLK